MIFHISRPQIMQSFLGVFVSLFYDIDIQVCFVQFKSTKRCTEPPVTAILFVHGLRFFNFRMSRLYLLLESGLEFISHFYNCHNNINS